MSLDELDAAITEARFRKAFDSKREFLAFILELLEKANL